MANLLAIETSYQLCSVALTYNSKLFSREIMGSRSHTENLLGFVDELLNEADIEIDKLDAIIFAAGPGTFTGVRLATSVAKSLAYAANIPVIAVSSLAVIAQAYLRENSGFATCRVITDARMGEVYVGDYVFKNGLATAIESDHLLTLQQLQQLPINGDYLLGDNEDILNAYSVAVSLPYQLVIARAEDALVLGQHCLELGQVETALLAQAIYLRDKSGWKTTAQQLADKKSL